MEEMKMSIVKKLGLLGSVALAGLGAAGCAPVEPDVCAAYTIADLVTENGRVTRRAYTPGDDGLAEGVAIGVAMDNLTLGIAMSPAFADEDQYRVEFLTESGKTFMSTDGNHYNSFAEGDTVEITYHHGKCLVSVAGR